MTTLPHHHSLAPAPFKLAVSRLADGWKRLAARLSRDLARPALNDRVLYRLSTLSDRDLSDIGLSRSDLADAALPENGDATRFLVERRDLRHQARHGRSPF